MRSRPSPTDAWIARKMGAILSTTLVRDAVNGSGHVARKVAGVEITPEDRDWRVRTLGRHPAVLAVWRGLVQQAIAA